MYTLYLPVTGFAVGGRRRNRIHNNRPSRNGWPYRRPPYIYTHTYVMHVVFVRSRRSVDRAIPRGTIKTAIAFVFFFINRFIYLFIRVYIVSVKTKSRAAANVFFPVRHMRYARPKYSNPRESAAAVPRARRGRPGPTREVRNSTRSLSRPSDGRRPFTPRRPRPSPPQQPTCLPSLVHARKRSSCVRR